MKNLVDKNRIRLYENSMNGKFIAIETDALNAPEQVVRVLREAILKGRMKAHQPMRQDLLARELGVSKVPVREALIQLKAEGLVRFVPNRGAVVSALSPAEVDEIYTMRIALETTALERAIPNLGKTDLIRAESVLNILDQEADKGQWSALNWEFHAILYQAAKMPRLLNTIEMLHNNVARYLILYLDRLSAQALSQQEHRGILEFCRSADIKKGVTLLSRHLAGARDRMMTFLHVQQA